MEAGQLVVPKKPGLGLAFDQAAIEALPGRLAAERLQHEAVVVDALGSNFMPAGTTSKARMVSITCATLTADQ